MRKVQHFFWALSFVLHLNVPLSVLAQYLTASNGQYPSTTQTIGGCNGTFTTFTTEGWNGRIHKSKCYSW